MRYRDDSLLMKHLELDFAHNIALARIDKAAERANARIDRPARIDPGLRTWLEQEIARLHFEESRKQAELLGRLRFMRGLPAVPGESVHERAAAFDFEPWHYEFAGKALNWRQKLRNWVNRKLDALTSALSGL